MAKRFTPDIQTCPYRPEVFLGYWNRTKIMDIWSVATVVHRSLFAPKSPSIANVFRLILARQ
jgi:hypothetical protein